jgi:CRISPR/Cas system-associated protein Cas5 (RAMP superfamily)
MASIIDHFNSMSFITYYFLFLKGKVKKYKSNLFNTQNLKYDKFIYLKHKRVDFKSYVNREDKYEFKRNFK